MHTIRHIALSPHKEDPPETFEASKAETLEALCKACPGLDQLLEDLIGKEYLEEEPFSLNLTLTWGDYVFEIRPCEETR